MNPVASAQGRHIFSHVPFTRLVGAQREFSEGGRARLVLDARPELGNVIGAVHGGAGARTAHRRGEVVQHDDSVAWCRASVTDPAGRLVAQAQGSFRYLPLPQATFPTPETTP